VKLSFGHDKDSKTAFTIHTAGDPQGTLNLSINLAAPDFDAKELSLTVGSTASGSRGVVGVASSPRSYNITEVLLEEWGAKQGILCARVNVVGVSAIRSKPDSEKGLGPL
jgi:hypothetical protein